MGPWLLYKCSRVVNAGPDDLCISWDRAINNGRLDVYDLLVELAEAGHQGLQAESIQKHPLQWPAGYYVAESIRHACMPLCVTRLIFVAGKRIAEQSVQRTWLNSMLHRWPVDSRPRQAQLSGCHQSFGIVLEGLKPKNSKVVETPSMLIISDVKVCSLAIFEFEYENVLQVKRYLCIER